MFKKVATLCFVLSMVGVGPLAAQGTGNVAGTARNANNGLLSGVKVQIRNVDTGALAGQTQSSNGLFTFTGLSQGSYIIEMVDASGRIIGASDALNVTPGASISGVTVTLSDLAAAMQNDAAIREVVQRGGSGFVTHTGMYLSAAVLGASAYTMSNDNDKSDQ